jgi:urea transport system ATP-binding protein
MSAPLLELRDVASSIGGSRILRGVEFSVRLGSVFCLMGRNGVGKTTTLKTINGLHATDRGELNLEGRSLVGLAPEARARRGVATVPQGREIFPHLTVEENLRLGAVALGHPPGEELERVFTLFPVLKEFLPRKGGALSGGQQQQLAIGRALLTRPRLLMLDEPTEGIQPNIIERIGEAILTLRREGRMGILLVEQYLDFCREFGDNFAILERGSVVACGAMTELTDELVARHLTV